MDTEAKRKYPVSTKYDLLKIVKKNSKFEKNLMSKTPASYKLCFYC